MAHDHEHNIPEEDQQMSQARFEQQLDESGKSLSDALRISFFVLKIIMVIVVVIFIASGVFKVNQNEKAMVLRFGKIRGFGPGRILEPGLHFAFPEPIDKIIKIPVKEVLTLPIDSFWYFETARDELRKDKAPPPRTMDPTRDGYLITRNEPIAQIEGDDYNMVHAKWHLTYRIEDIERFYANVYYRDTKPGETFKDVLKDSVEPVLKSITEDAVVTNMVRYNIDEAITNAPQIAADVKTLVQKKLDAIQSGITVVSMQVEGRISWPRQVDDAFQKLNQAKQNSKQTVTEARGYAEIILNEAAGPRAEEIIAAMKAPDLIEKQKQDYLSLLSGKAQENIYQSWAYRTNVVETAKANADYLKSILPEYRKRPELVLRRIYQDAVENILEGVDEKIVISPGTADKEREIRLLVNRDPAIRKNKKQNQEK